MWNITTIFCGWGLAYFLFWRKGLSYLVPGETAQPEKEEAAQIEMLKPQTWVGFKTDFSFSSKVAGLLAQTWYYKPLKGLCTPVSCGQWWSSLVSIKKKSFAYTVLFFFSLDILLPSQKSGNIVYFQSVCFYNAFNLKFRLYVWKVNAEN